MKPKAEVIAMLMPEGDASERARTATLLLRDANGAMSLQTVSTDSTLGQEAMNTGCFRRGKPIFDPVARQVLGYEMEMIPGPLAQFA